MVKDKDMQFFMINMKIKRKILPVSDLILNMNIGSKLGKLKIS